MPESKHDPAEKILHLRCILQILCKARFASMRATFVPCVECNYRRRAESVRRPPDSEQRASDERRDAPDTRAYQIRRDFAVAG